MVRVSSSFEIQAAEYAVFHVGDVVCGLAVDSIREINRNLDVTRVHLASDYVRGVINLRGQIVTVIDLRQKFGLPPRDIDDWMRIIVVRSTAEDIGLLVDKVDDIVPIVADKIEKPPPHIRDVAGDFFSGVYKMDDKLVAILNVERLLQKD